MRELKMLISNAADVEEAAKRMSAIAVMMRAAEAGGKSGRPTGDTRVTLNSIGNMALDVAAGFVNEIAPFSDAQRAGDLMAGELQAEINTAMQERGLKSGDSQSWQDCRAEAITCLRWVLGKVQAKFDAVHAEEEAKIATAPLPLPMGG